MGYGDLRGDRLAVVLALLAIASPAYAGQTSYEYDARGRLVRVNKAGTPGYGATYSYDRADNRLSYAVTATGSGGGTPPPASTRGFAVVPLNGFKVIPLGQ